MTGVPRYQPWERLAVAAARAALAHLAYWGLNGRLSNEERTYASWATMARCSPGFQLGVTSLNARFVRREAVDSLKGNESRRESKRERAGMLMPVNDVPC